MLRKGPASVPTLVDVWAVLRHTWEDPELDQLAMDNVYRLVSQVNSRYITEHNLPEGLQFRPDA
jgi:hypothetical protein